MSEPSLKDPPTFPLDRPTPYPDILYRQIFGGSLICCMIMLVLYGLSILQTHLYYLNYPNDQRPLKMMVALLFCMSTLHAVFLCHTLYHYHVFSYHDPLLLIGGVWSLFMGTATGVGVCFVVQLFYTRMIYHLTKKKWRWFLTILLVLLIVMQLVFGILTVIGEFHEWDIAKISDIALTSIVPMLTARVASDSVTALSLCILLRSARPGTGFLGSGRLVHALIIYAVNRFLLTTVIVIVQVAALISSPKSIWAMIIDFISVHLYVNSCLATLNSRNHLRNLSKSSTTGISGFLDTNTGLRFNVPHSSTVGGATSALNVDLNSSSRSDSMRIEMDEYVKAKPDQSDVACM